MHSIKLFFKIGFLLVVIVCSNCVFAQGPPITVDKPIMLGKGSFLVRTLSEYRKTNQGTFVNTPLIGHYLPKSNLLLGVHLPIVYYNSEINFGDIDLLFKYQFLRKDQKGKTLRGVFKILQTLPTGKELMQMNISTGIYQSYQGFILGYESLKLGFTNELGVVLSESLFLNRLQHKMSVGIPFLKPNYPVKQINLFCETQSNWFLGLNQYNVLYAQGLQYAKGKWTFEIAYQFPVYQSNHFLHQRDYSLYIGSRIII